MRQLTAVNSSEKGFEEAASAAAGVTAELMVVAGRGKDSSTRFAYTGAECRYLRSAIHSLFCSLFFLKASFDGEIKSALARIDSMEQKLSAMEPRTKQQSRSTNAATLQ